MNGKEQTTAAGRKGRWFLLAATVTLAGAAVISEIMTRGGEAEDDKPVVEPVEVDPVRAVSLKNQSQGLLENGPMVLADGSNGLESAADMLGELGRMLPREALPPTNLAIGRYLQLEATRGAAVEERQAAFEAAEALEKFDPESPLPYWLRAKMHLHASAGTDVERQRVLAAEQFEQAIEKQPDNPVFHLALYDVGQLIEEDPWPETARTALREAYRLRPRNFYLLSELLVVQAENQDEGLVESLETAEELLRPVDVRLARYNVFSPSGLIGRAKEAAQNEDWAMAERFVRQLQNVVRPLEVAKSDHIRVAAHPLEFVVHDFSDDFYQKHPMPRERAGGADDLLEISWVPASGLPAVTLPEDIARIEQFHLVDFDLDGREDIVALATPARAEGDSASESQEASDGDQTLLVLSRADGGQAWSVVARRTVTSGYTGILAADLDRDRVASETERPLDTVLPAGAACHEADPDLVLYGDAGVIVLKNARTDNGRDLEEVAQSESFRAETGITAARLVDLDHDGDLDLITSGASGVKLWLTTAPFLFSDASDASELPADDVTFQSLVAVDFDRDVDIDVLCFGAESSPNGVLENLRHGQFRWRPWGDDEPISPAGGQAVVLEADGNAAWDIVTSGEDLTLYTSTQIEPGRSRLVQETILGEGPFAGGLRVADTDNNGRQDILALDGGGQVVLFRHQGEGFGERELVFGNGSVTQIDVADMSGDGDLDVVVLTDDGRVQVVENDGGSENAWLRIYPMGQADNRDRCNHHAIGSMVEVRAGTDYQAQVVDRPWVHFGLGDVPEPDVARIIWTNGVPQALVEPRNNVGLCELMQLKGSCPYIYTWDGEQYRFFTDCLWAAPIGLQVAEGVLAPSRSWEYLLIPGDRMKATDGHYRVMLTEELWEAAYFDTVQLLVVDHPADYSVYSNEKVGPPAIAEYRVHTVREPRLPIAARDSNGRDVMDGLRSVDGTFVQPFAHRYRQGLVDEHYLELDLGQLEDPQSIRLFLTGWIYPTDTSLNIAFSQHPELDGPQLPSVWVPDAEGEWRQTLPVMGFPGGKTKTIVVDLSDAFLTEDYRVRIQTSAELYWDAAFFTVDEEPGETRVVRVAPSDARLFYRGFSPGLPVADRAPRLYDASAVDPGPRWPPMRGAFTKYGDVLPILSAQDDQLVVLGSGDAMELSFPVPEQPLPDGWVRDFLLYSVGWDKDADMNTEHGQSVEPLPFGAMERYPFDGHRGPDSDEYHRYLETYQTRYQPHEPFWRALQAPVPLPAGLTD